MSLRERIITELISIAEAQPTKPHASQLDRELDLVKQITALTGTEYTLQNITFENNLKQAYQKWADNISVTVTTIEASLLTWQVHIINAIAQDRGYANNISNLSQLEAKIILLRFIKNNGGAFNFIQWLLNEELGFGQAVDGTWVTFDRIGTDNTRLPERGHCYSGDGTAHILITGLLTTDTIETPSYSDDPTCTIDGRLDIANTENVGAITIKRAGVTWAFYKCDEQSGSDCFDSSGNGNDGVITSATLANFHAIDNTFYSFLNFVGYTLVGAVYVPRDEGDITKDVQGNALGFTGEVKRNGKIVNSNICQFDGIGSLINCGNDSLLNLGTDNFTLTFTVSFNVTGTNQGLIIKSNGGSPSGTNYGYYIYKDTNDKIILVTRGSNSVNYIVTSQTVLSSSVLYEVVITANVSTNDTHIYINGVDTTITESGTLGAVGTIANTLNLTLGSESDGGNYLSSEACCFGYWKEVKTLSEVRAVDDVDLVCFYKCSEGGGDKAYDISTNNLHGTITNAVLANFRALDTTGKFRPNNIIDGFEYYDDDATHLNIIRVPYNNDGTKITPTISGYSKISENDASYYHNNAESDIQQYKTPQMFINDSDNFFFDLSGNANDISYADIVAQVADNIFADVDNANAKSDLRTKEIVSNYWDDAGVWDDTGFGVT